MPNPAEDPPRGTLFIIQYFRPEQYKYLESLQTNTKTLQTILFPSDNNNALPSELESIVSKLTCDIYNALWSTRILANIVNYGFFIIIIASFVVAAYTDAFTGRLVLYGIPLMLIVLMIFMYYYRVKLNKVLRNNLQHNNAYLESRGYKW